MSAEVLDAVGAARRLSGPERRHLYLLAGLNPPPPGPARDAEVTPQLRRLPDAWGARPAVLRDRYWHPLTVTTPA
ncbi:hypothetical protein ACWEQA_12335 [Nocardia sp. NPDC004085]